MSGLEPPGTVSPPRDISPPSESGPPSYAEAITGGSASVGFRGFSSGDFSEAAVIGQGYFPPSNDPGGSRPMLRESATAAASRIGSGIAGSDLPSTAAGFRPVPRLLNFTVEYRDQTVNLKVPDSESVGKEEKLLTYRPVLLIATFMFLAQTAEDI